MTGRHAVPAPRARHRLAVASVAAVALVAGGAATTGQAHADATATTTASSTSPIVLQDRRHELPVGPTAVPEKGRAEVYPMAGTVPAGTGSVTEVQLDLEFAQHTFADDLDVMLVGPDGTAVTVMSDVGDSSDLLGRSYRFGDLFSSTMADSDPNPTGNYRPTDVDTGGEDAFDLPAPPAAEASDHLAVFNGREAAGTWRVFVMDDTSSDFGAIKQATVRVFTDGRAAPYQSVITVPSGLGAVTDIDVALHGLSHTYTGDLQIALVGPGGQSVLLMSDVGDDPVAGDLVLDDEASPMPDVFPAGGTFHPTGAGRDDGPDVFPAPGPALTMLGDQLSVFDGAGAAGTWSLFVIDDQSGDSGAVSGGWSMTVTTLGAPAPQPVPVTQAPPAAAPDTDAPRVVRVRTAVRPGSDLVLGFSEPVAPLSVSRRTVTLAARGGRLVPVPLRLTAGGDRLVIDPRQRLRRSGRYVLTVSTQVRDRSGNRLQQELVKRFSTR